MIQVFVFPDAWWTVHAYWAALLLVLIARGPGALALDRLFAGAKTAEALAARLFLCEHDRQFVFLGCHLRPEERRLG